MRQDTATNTAFRVHNGGQTANDINFEVNGNGKTVIGKNDNITLNPDEEASFAKSVTSDRVNSDSATFISI